MVGFSSLLLVATAMVHAVTAAPFARQYDILNGPLSSQRRNCFGTPIKNPTSRPPGIDAGYVTYVRVGTPGAPSDTITATVYLEGARPGTYDVRLIQVGGGFGILDCDRYWEGGPVTTDLSGSITFDVKESLLHGATGIWVLLSNPEKTRYYSTPVSYFDGTTGS
ncbi:hypothetical protein EHS25_004699 [Saitozyma podzolica]|jgi:hypothetical protein|uniref:Uncharacterized protein n=1 Tax=Saitozyma podzolica TaxID=1890683 RepID=A0A427YUS0_9TREE|nr:hypothetical protein EHS25_004699 [Saitozyma podzolica]